MEKRRTGALMPLYACLIPLFVIALLSSACNGADENGDDDPDQNGDPSGLCVDDEDCEPNQRCEGGFCEDYDPPECEVTGCDPHSFCDPEDGQCKESGEKPCSHDDDCGEGFICPEPVGLCVEACVVNTDCASHLVCNNELEACVDCAFDSDCDDPDRPHCISEEGRCVECFEPLHCPNNYYCELSEGSDDRYSCLEGCLDGNDCTPGTSCERPGDAPGRCVECSPETATQDCPDGDRQRCHPDLLMCVQCFQHDHCTSPAAEWCHQEEWVCVECLQHDHCQMGMVCVGEDSICELGCVGDERCPPVGDADLVHCDPSRGQHGECLECLEDEHCHLGYKCDDGSCVEGCDSDDNCPSHKPRCDLMADRCVECLGDGDCPGYTKCDMAENECVCLALHDPCSFSDECGNPPYDGVCHGFVWCVTEYKPEDRSTVDFEPMTQPRCAIPCDGNVDAPCEGDLEGNPLEEDYCCRKVKNEQGEEGRRCLRGGC